MTDARTHWACCDGAHDNAKPRDIADRLAAALGDLVSVQNGPPLPSYEDAWRAAMMRAQRALDAYREREA